MKRSLMSAVASALTDSALSLAMISFGVPFGATNPNHDCTSKPATPASPIVGTSGAEGERCALVTANARSLPAFTCGNAEGMLSNITCTCPPIISVIAGALPLYGMCTISTFASILNNSPER